MPPSIDRKVEYEAWFIDGVKHSADYLLIVTDLFSFEDKPIYVHDWEDIKDIVRSYEREKDYRQQEVTAVYNLKKAMGPQLSSADAWFY